MGRRYSRREFVRRTSLAGLGLTGAAWLSDAARAEDHPADVNPLWQSFLKPPDDARIMFRWWWFGPAQPFGERDAGLSFGLNRDGKYSRRGLQFRFH
jgi:hypothetical protein